MNHRWLHGIALLAGLILAGPSGAAARETTALVVGAPLAPPAARALMDLEHALQARGSTVARHATLPEEGPALVLGTAGSPLVDRLLSAHRLELPEAAESLCIRTLRLGGRTVLLLAGRDARGLSYALLDAARALSLAPKDRDPLTAVPDALESPFLRTRSITVHLLNADLEAEWYFEERFWNSYFALLARCRYNNFTLTFSDQTNYLNPVYAYLVDVPGRPHVRVQGLSDAGQRRNLAMLKRIAELAHEWGLDFTLGIWTQQPVPRYVSPNLVEQLPPGLAAADYCATGLQRVLRACPAIDAVQFRMNSEAGVPEDQQLDFYRPLFRALRDCGRPVRVDLRYKGLRATTLEAALELGLDTTVSTKFWCEHLGLPYHPTVADRHYREDRYSFGSMLSYPRKYRVVYQLWSVGSQRLLLWGDPDYARRFAESCRLGNGEGFEIFAPLTNKGFGNLPGKWRIFADRSLEQSSWEHERYWFFYLAFGRLGYNPHADPEIWRRELRTRFGDAAEAMEAGYRHASQILPFLTAVRLPSASEWGWWPEMDTGDRLNEYMHTPPSDTAQFYGIRSWKRTPNWRCEKWDPDITGYVEDAVAGRLRAKWTPIQVSRRLRDLCNQALQSVARAKEKIRDSQDAEFRATSIDFQVLAQLARYHAAKTQAATELAFFELTGARGRLSRSLEPMREAAAAWEQIVRLTEGVYHSNLVFGYSPQHGRRMGHHHAGHWKDRLAEIRADVAYLEELLRKTDGKEQVVRTFPSETPAAELPRVEHTPVQTVQPGKDLTLEVAVAGPAPVHQVVLHYRPVNQTQDWKQFSMEKTGNGHYRATVPAKEIPARWDFQYYFEVLLEGGGGRLWPSWEHGAPYLVTKVGRRAEPSFRLSFDAGLITEHPIHYAFVKKVP